MALISIVVPVFNEQECLPALLQRLTDLGSTGTDPFEIILVDDGSTDRSREIIMDFCSRHEKARHVFFSRNFGHEAASTAGIDHASGDAVVIIDADLQDPPEVIPELISKWREGYHVVYARRRTRPGEGIMKRFTSWLFYRIIRYLSDVNIPADTGDFRLVDRRVMQSFRRCREQNRFVRGLIAWQGFRQTAVMYHRDERMAGETKYSLFKLVALALDAAVGFSMKPLRMGMYLGLLVTLFSLAMVGVLVVQKIMFGMPFQGYALLAAAIFFMGGVQIFLIGLAGEYIGRTYRQTQQRPLYVIESKSSSLPPAPEGWHGGEGNRTAGVGPAGI